MAELTKVPAGKRYVCSLVAFEPGAVIPSPWRGKGRLVDAPQPPPRTTRLTWEQQKAQRELAVSDAGMVRVIEDVVDTLVAKGVIAMTDLPTSAAEKLSARHQQREAMAGTSK